MSDLWNCPICLLNYDNKDYLPKILFNCGHTVCSKCLNKIGTSKSPECPLDQKEIPLETIKNAPVNHAFLNIIERSQSVCQQHKKIQNMACLTDEELLCELCVEKDHKNHKNCDFNGLKDTAASKRKDLESRLTKFNEIKSKKDIFFADIRRKLMNDITTGFEKISNALKEKEDEWKNFFDCALTLENNLLIDAIEKDDKIKKKHELGVSDLKITTDSDIVNNRVLRTLNKDYQSFISEKSWQYLSQVDYKLQKEVEENLKRFAWVLNDGSQIRISGQDDTLINASTPLFFNINNLLHLEIKEGTLSIENKESPFKKNINILKAKTFDKEQLSMLKKITIRLDLMSSQVFTLVQLLFKWCKGISDVNIAFGQILDLEILKSDSDTLFGTENIKNMRMGVGYCKEISDAAFSSIFLNPLRKMTNLKQFYLNLSHADINNKNLKHLCSEIKEKLPILSSFNLNLNRTKVDDSVFEQLFENISKEITIENFILSLDQTQISDASVNRFARTLLPRLRHICELELSFSDASISDFSIVELCTRLREVAGKLKKLKLAFNGTKITNKSIDSLSEHIIKNANALKVLEIDFSNTKVNDEGMKHLSNSLKDRMSNLKQFELDISNNDITDSIVSKFCETIISEIEDDLYSFSLSLDETFVTQEGLKALASSLSEKIKTLNSIIMLSVDLDIKQKTLNATNDEMMNIEDKLGEN